jgi:hypothetical protein
MSRVTIDLHIQMLCAVLHVSHILGTQKLFWNNGHKLGQSSC